MAATDLTAGRVLAEVSFRLDASLVQQYLAVVEDRSALYQASHLVPPTALAALGIRALLEGLSLPSGSVHAAQELTMHRAVAIGEQVSCRARVAQNSRRREWQFIVLEFALVEGGVPVLDGRSTLLVPA